MGEKCFFMCISWTLELSLCCLDISSDGRIAVVAIGGLFCTPDRGVPYEPPDPTVESAKLRLSSTVFTWVSIVTCLSGLYHLHLRAEHPTTIIMKVNMLWL